jgi:NADH dehydrogenase [ubiquinone] 1 alpha subcomplex assembly factor 1
MRKSILITALSLLCMSLLISCSSETGSSPPTESSVTTELVPPVTTAPVPPPTPNTSVLFEFATPQSVNGWSSVDDSVMGGISASTTMWVETGGFGALLFSGRMTTEQNGGFTSTLGPSDQRLGQVATGATALGVSAIGDGRTYVMQLRAGRSGQDRWIARFTPTSTTGASSATLVLIPIESFAPVSRFLRPITPNSPLDPSTIEQIGIYLIDEQVGNFRLAIEQITAIR